MPILSVDSSFSKKSIEGDKLKAVKRKLTIAFKKQVGDYKVTHKVITHGNPTGKGDIKPGFVLIRSSAQVPLDDIPAIKEKLKLKPLGDAK